MEFQHRFFREKAVKEYIQRQEKEYLPQFFSLQRVVLAYLVLFVVLLAGLLVWCSEVPLFANGSGFVLAPTAPVTNHRHLEIVLFLPARYAAQLRPGEKVEWQPVQAGTQFPGTVQAVNSDVLGLGEARELYLMNGYPARLQASSIVEVVLKPIAANLPHVQIGEMVRAQVQIGSRHIF